MNTSPPPDIADACTQMVADLKRLMLEDTRRMGAMVQAFSDGIVSYAKAIAPLLDRRMLLRIRLAGNAYHRRKYVRPSKRRANSGRR